MPIINRKFIVLLAIGLIGLLQTIKAQEKTTVNGTVTGATLSFYVHRDRI